MTQRKTTGQRPQRSEPSRLSKHRAEMRRRGFKLVQLWVPDPEASGFRQAVRRTREFLETHPDREWDTFASRVLDEGPGWDDS